MITIDDMRTYVTRAVTEGTDTPDLYDIPAITDDLHARFGLVDLDTVGVADFWGAVWLGFTGPWADAPSINDMIGRRNA